VFGDDSLGQSLKQTVKGKSIGNRAIEIKRISDATRIGPCQILFVARSKTPQTARVLAPLGSASVLLVGESPGFLAAGGAINFTNQDGQVHFEVNTAAAERVGLKISSKLLRVATSVTSTPQGTAR
jgi:hypothetical protein